MIILPIHSEIEIYLTKRKLGKKFDVRAKLK